MACSSHGQGSYNSAYRSVESRTLDHTIHQLLDASITKATKMTYHNAVALYRSFLRSTSFSTREIFPISVSSLAGFIAYLVQKSYKSTSIQTNIAGLSYVHTILGLPNPTGNSFIKKLLKGSKRLLFSPDKRLPITIPFLHLMVSSLSRLHTVKYYQVMYRAMFLLAFHALLRVGEYTTRGSDWGHVIKRENIHFTVKNKRIHELTIKMPHFKHSIHPVTLALTPAKKHQFCPVASLATYVISRGPIKGPLFINCDGSPVSMSQFSRIFRQSVEDAGLDPVFYKPHSLRIGATTWIHQLNLSDSRIQEVGRWRSSAYKRYIRIPMVPL